MPKAIVVYATRTGETKLIGEYIAEGLRISGVETDVVSTGEIKKEVDLEGYDFYIFGSATYHGDMLPGMKTFLFLAEKANLKGKIGGAFGAYGWSGEALERIFETMKNVFQMNMVNAPLYLKGGSLAGGMQVAHSYGRDIAGKK